MELDLVVRSVAFVSDMGFLCSWLLSVHCGLLLYILR